MPVTRQYWWIVASAEGKPFLIFGSDKGESDALARGRELLPGTDFEIKKYPTMNLQRASALHRGVRLKSTRSLKVASQRLGHEKSAKRLRSKKASKPKDWDPFNSY